MPNVPRAAVEIAEAIRDDLNRRSSFDFGELDEDIQQEILAAHAVEAWERVKPLVEALNETKSELGLYNGHSATCPQQYAKEYRCRCRHPETIAEADALLAAWTPDATEDVG